MQIINEVGRDHPLNSTTFQSFFKKWANPGLFLVYYCPFLIAITITVSICTIINWKKRRWCAWDNPWPQDSRKPRCYVGHPPINLFLVDRIWRNDDHRSSVDSGWCGMPGLQEEVHATFGAQHSHANGPRKSGKDRFCFDRWESCF